MKKTLSVVLLDNKLQKNKIKVKLKKMQKFSDTEFFIKRNQKFIVKQLGLRENNYWKEFKKEVLRKIKENGYVVVKGLPFDDNNRLFVGLTCFIGNPIIQYNKKKPAIVWEITPRLEPIYDENHPHTDSVYWPNLTDILALQCISEDQKGGGKSRIVTVDAILSKLKHLDHYNIVKNLREEKYPFSLDPRFGDSGIHMQHVLTREKYDEKYYYFNRFLKTDIENTAKKFKIKLPKKALEAIKIFEKTATKIGEKEEFLVRKGELLLCDNRRALHSRSEVEPKSKRKLKRIKLNLDRKALFKS